MMSKPRAILRRNRLARLRKENYRLYQATLKLAGLIGIDLIDELIGHAEKCAGLWLVVQTILEAGGEIDHTWKKGPTAKITLTDERGIARLRFWQNGVPDISLQIAKWDGGWKIIIHPIDYRMFARRVDDKLNADQLSERACAAAMKPGGGGGMAYHKFQFGRRYR